MDESVRWSIFTQLFSYDIPVWIIWIAGIILSIYFRRQNQKKFTLTLIAFLIFLLASISHSYIYAIIAENSLPFSHNITEVQAGTYADLLSCISTFASIIGWIVLLIAIFSRKLNSTKEA